MSNENETPPVESRGGLRKLLLFALLAIALVALGYDYLYARPAVNSAYDSITSTSEKINSDGTEVFTNAKLAELIGRAPATQFQDGNDLVEVFHFTSGIPFRPHKLFVVYKRNGVNQIFYRHEKFGYEPTSVVSPIDVLKVIENPPGYSGEDDIYAADAAGQHGGGPSPLLDGMPDPEVVFRSQDVNGDNILMDDEIPLGILPRLEEIDTNGDGAISIQEMRERVAATRQREADQAEAEQVEVEESESSESDTDTVSEDG